ncbi:hypothetical protein BC835DRAFT_1311296 [Cytidiella melzeri]|nr:hypothetical protein BC835DRAFT_1311296 [Cytidiella melzeri]
MTLPVFTLLSIFAALDLSERSRQQKEIDTSSPETALERVSGSMQSGSARPVGSSTMILGGIGFLSRLQGLSTDSVMEVEVVIADGKTVVVNKDEDPDSLIKHVRDCIKALLFCYLGAKDDGLPHLQALSSWDGECCLLLVHCRYTYRMHVDSRALWRGIADYADTCVPKEQREAAWTTAALYQWKMGIDDPKCIEAAEEFLARHKNPSTTNASFGKNWDCLAALKRKYITNFRLLDKDGEPVAEPYSRPPSLEM